MPNSPNQPANRVKWWICVLLLLATTLNYMDRQALSQTAVRLTQYFQINNQDLGLLESSFNIAFAIGAISIGIIADRGNLWIIYPIIVVGWSLAGLAAGFAHSFTILLVCRFCLGFFEAGNWPCGILTVKRILKPEERSLGNGMFQSGTALGAILTPMVVLICLSFLEVSDASSTDAIWWQLPFRVVGLAGIFWAILWLCTVRAEQVRPDVQTAEAVSDSYWDIWRARRFWVLLIVVVSINIAWRSFGFWLPKFLQQEKEYGEKTTAMLTSGFFAFADLGSIAVGAGTLWLFRRGIRLVRARQICFGVCAAMAAMSVVAAIAPKGVLLIAILFVVGFGALGLFPTYFAMSQEISQRHQAKVTGTLGCLNAVFLAVMFPVQGYLIDRFGSFSLALGVAGLFPVVGLVALFFWGSDSKTAK